MKLWKKYTPLIVKAIKKQLTKKGAHWKADAYSGLLAYFDQ